MVKVKKVSIHTDGGCKPNPGPGGYGVVLRYMKHRKELSGGFRRTTNNRMEIYAAIAGLASLKEHCSVEVYTDSQYLANAIAKGWALRWQRNGWMRTKQEKALNSDLWEELLKLTSFHDVEFKWVRGHAGDTDNERCDLLAGRARKRPDLAPDLGYESTPSPS